MRKYATMMLAALLLTGCQSQEQKREASPVRVETETVGLRTDYAQTPYVGQVVEQSSTAVSFMSAGTVRQTSVPTADTHGGRIVITDGLREGDTVITSGWQKLSEGTRVETKK